MKDRAARRHSCLAVLGLVLLGLLLSSCVPVNEGFYETPSLKEDYATIEDSPDIRRAFTKKGSKKKAVDLESIDRVRVRDELKIIPYKLRGKIQVQEPVEPSITVLTPGVRKLEFVGRKQQTGIGDALQIGFLWDFEEGLYCARAVLSLNVESGHHYLADAEINKKEDYAEFWISDKATGDIVAGPIRVFEVKDEFDICWQ